MIEYRIGSMYYEGSTKCHIEKRVDGGKWKLLFGNLTYQDAQRYLENPDEIERFNNYLKKCGIFTLVLFISLIIWFIFFAPPFF